MRPSTSARLLLLSAFFAVAIAAAEDSPAPGGLVATSRLVHFEDVDDGQTIHRFGDKPLGLFVYTADGKTWTRVHERVH